MELGPWRGAGEPPPARPDPPLRALLVPLPGGRRPAAMPEFLADPSVLTKEKLKSELIANNVSLPGGEQRKDVYVQLYLQHLTARNPPAAAQPDFSSDEEREHTPLGVRNRGAAAGRVSAAAAPLPPQDTGTRPRSPGGLRPAFPPERLCPPAGRGSESGVRRRCSPPVLSRGAGDGSASVYARGGPARLRARWCLAGPVPAVWGRGTGARCPAATWRREATGDRGDRCWAAAAVASGSRPAYAPLGCTFGGDGPWGTLHPVQGQRDRAWSVRQPPSCRLGSLYFDLGGEIVSKIIGWWRNNARETYFGENAPLSCAEATLLCKYLRMKG